MFQLIKKCDKNAYFPKKSNIEVIDKLYRSLPSEFVNNENVFMLLK